MITRTARTKYGDGAIVAKLKGTIYRLILSRHPRLRAIVRRGQYLCWRAGTKLRALLPAATARYDPDQILWVDPRRIENCAAMEGSTYTIRGLVADGDWDIQDLPFSGWDLYKAFERHFLEGAPWTETAYYQNVLASIQRGNPRWGCTTREAFHQRLASLDALWEDMRENGYRTQRELAASAKDDHAWDRDSPFKLHDEVVICIGRDGDLLFRDGKHRLAMAKLLGISRIPVVVGLRHRAWHEFREEILEYARTHGGMVYQPLTHPDLVTIPAQHDDRRFELMENALPEGCRTLLDLGSHWGFFCHRFEERGLACTAVENHPRHLYFMRKLHRAERRSFTILPSSLTDLKGPLRYDVVLALNICHHFLKTKEMSDTLWRFLGRLEGKVMFFETACPQEPVMADAAMNPTPDEFARLVAVHSMFKNIRHLGNVGRNRPLYVLEP